MESDRVWVAFSASGRASTRVKAVCAVAAPATCQEEADDRRAETDPDHLRTSPAASLARSLGADSAHPATASRLPPARCPAGRLRRLLRLEERRGLRRG